MSKPKPGLGKGIVRTLAHSSQHVTTYTAGGNAAGSVGQLVPVTAINHPLPSTSTTFASSSHTRRRRGSADGFASLGLPTYDEGYPRNVGGSNAGGGGADGLRSTSMVTNGPTGSGSSTTWPLSSNLSTLSAQSSTPYLSLLPLWDTSSQVVAESSASAANLLLTDVVQPFRPVAARPYSTSSTARDRTATLSSVSARLSSSNSGRAHLSTISTPIATSPASPEIPPSLLSSLSLPSLANWNSLLSDKTSLFADRNILSDIGLFGADRPFSFTTKFTSPYSFLDPSNGKSHADILVTEIVTLPPSPSPNPEARPPRQSEVHPALSSSTPSQSDSTLSTGQQTTSAYPFSALAVSSATSDNAVSSSEAESSTAAQKTYSSNLVFHLGASGSAKERPPSRRPPSNSSSTRSPSPRPRSFPIPDVSPPSASEWRSIGVGEDAYFARMDGMCVADGVGGWARSGKGGADAGRWSRLLTHFCEKEVDEWWKGAPEYLSSAGKGNSADSEAGKPKERRRIRLSIGGGGGGGADLSGGWAQKVWKDGERAKEGMMREESRRRPLDPVEIMQRGYEKCLSCFLKEGINGSSTCLLALLHHSTLHIANLGDCCLLLIRAGEVIFRTDEMQHAFNFPLQLGTHSRDEPMKDAKRYDVGVGKGDVVVVGSDGLMDNLFDEDILDTLSQFAPPLRSAFPSESSQAETTPSAAATPAPKPSIFSPSSFFSRSRDSTPPTPPDPRSLPAFSPQKVSEELCRRARAVSEQTSATTPFMVRAIDEGIDFVGGKKDDISVLVGVIGDRDGSDGLALHTI